MHAVAPSFPVPFRVLSVHGPGGPTLRQGRRLTPRCASRNRVSGTKTDTLFSGSSTSVRDEDWRLFSSSGSLLPSHKKSHLPQASLGLFFPSRCGLRVNGLGRCLDLSVSLASVWESCVGFNVLPSPTCRFGPSGPRCVRPAEGGGLSKRSGPFPRFVASPVLSGSPNAVREYGVSGSRAGLDLRECPARCTRVSSS